MMSIVSLKIIISLFLTWYLNNRVDYIIYSETKHLVEVYLNDALIVTINYQRSVVLTNNMKLN